MYIAHIRNDSAQQSCTEHSLNTAQLAMQAVEGVDLGNAAYLAGLLHDCGKFTAEFEAYIRAAAAGEGKKGTVIHSFAGVYYLLKRWHSRGEMEEVTSEILAAAVAGHHGLIDIYNDMGENAFAHRLTKQSAYEERAVSAFRSECAGENELTARFQRAAVEIERCITKIAGSAQNNGEIFFYCSLLVRLLTSAVVEGDRADTAAFMSGTAPVSAPDPDWAGCSAQLELLLAQMSATTKINAARAAFSVACAEAADLPEGIYRLNLPTGGGKTLAALRYALRHAEKFNKRHIIYVAPLITILEQNTAVIQAAIGDKCEILEHHSNVLNELRSADELDKYELAAQTWDAPVIVTTLVRLLENMYDGRMSSVRRFHALCNSVIIFDEIQSLPTHIITLFNLAINFLSEVCHTTVILCSATQPAFEKVDHALHISDKEIVPHRVTDRYAALFKRTQITDKGNMSTEQILGFIRSVLNERQSLLVVCNTKAEAAGLYNALKLDGIRKFHLSAGMCGAHRKATLSALETALAQREKLICISTQVIEAGIDISFDSVIRYYAGLDSIVQAAGRCNRHGEAAAPCPVYILHPVDEKLGALKSIAAAQGSLNGLLAEYRRDPAHFGGDLASSSAVSYYYSRLFEDMKIGEQDFPAGRKTLFELLSENEHADVNYVLCQAFKTAGELFKPLEEDTRSVLVPYENGKKIIEKACTQRAVYDIIFVKDLINQAKAYSVSVPTQTFNRFRQEGALHDLCEGRLSYVEPEYYDEFTGLSTQKKEDADKCSILIL